MSVIYIKRFWINLSQTVDEDPRRPVQNQMHLLHRMKVIFCLLYFCCILTYLHFSKTILQMEGSENQNASLVELITYVHTTCDEGS